MLDFQFQFLNRPNFEGSTRPLFWLTEGMLILEVKRTSGASLG
jgi:hypothetical protein